MDRSNKKELVLQCFGFKGKNGNEVGYYAACVNIGLITFRPTFEEAKNSLEDAIFGYIETAVEQSTSEEDLDNLLHQPLPFWPWRAKYLLISLIVKLLRKSCEPKDILFNKSIPVPAV